MSPSRENHSCLLCRFPRVSGDEPLGEALENVRRMFSPRERG